MSTAYEKFIGGKLQVATGSGFEPLWLPDFLFDFQKHLVDWSLRKGRGALFEGCGLGKTPQSLVWAENVARKTNGRVLVLTPLAVAPQFVREGAKFDIAIQRSRAGELHPGINVTNYERLHHFRPGDFSGVVCDEAGILKSFDGSTRKAIIDFMRTVPYRLLCTATPAPNDYFELGSSSEALGGLGFMDMLNTFFKNARNNSSMNRAWQTAGGGAPQWRFRGHAEKPFWRWVCSWARALEKPSDIGFPDGAFALPPLIDREHIVKATKARDGMLFSVPAVGLAEEREERRRTMVERCEMVASLVSTTGRPAVCWGSLNDECDLMEKMIAGSVQVSGRDSDDEKEEKYEAFTSGQARVLVVKPVLASWGLNWQHCAHMTAFGSHSFEMHYQSVRRFWRFGQTLPVIVDHVLSDGEQRVLANLRRKTEQATKLFQELASNIEQELHVQRGRAFDREEVVPSWL